MAVRAQIESLRQAIDLASVRNPIEMFFPTSAYNYGNTLFIRNFTRLIPHEQHSRGIRSNLIDFSQATGDQGDYILAAIFQGARNRHIKRLSTAENVVKPIIPLNFDRQLRDQFNSGLVQAARITKQEGWNDKKLELYLNIGSIFNSVSTDPQFDPYGVLIYCLSESSTFGVGFGLFARFFPKLNQVLQTNISNMPLSYDNVRGLNFYSNALKDMKNLTIADLLTYLTLYPAGHYVDKK